MCQPQWTGTPFLLTGAHLGRSCKRLSRPVHPCAFLRMPSLMHRSSKQHSGLHTALKMALGMMHCAVQLCVRCVSRGYSLGSPLNMGAINLASSRRTQPADSTQFSCPFPGSLGTCRGVPKEPPPPPQHAPCAPSGLLLISVGPPPTAVG